MKKVYIIGAVTGLNRKDVETKFSHMEMKLKELGFIPVNPIRLVNEDASWKEAMKICINNLIECDAYVHLPCWESSRGAFLETIIARNMSIDEYIII